MSFSEVSFLFTECEMRREALRCRHSMYSDDMIIADVTRSLIGRARRVSHRTTRFVDSHLDPVYRNGVMAYVKQLNKGNIYYSTAMTQSIIILIYVNIYKM